MAHPPAGTICFLFTDIEGSTRLWEEYPAAMQRALARHDAILHASITGQGGTVFKTIGDAFCAAFPHAGGALAAALAAQHALGQEDWPAVGGGPISDLRVRMALHTGVVEQRDGDYFGPPLNRIARLLAAGHGGQILLSAAAATLLRPALPPGVTLHDLGEHRLRDLIRPEQVFQLVTPDSPASFPPLRSLEAFAHNLPVQATSFIGREPESAEIKRLLEGQAGPRMLTLTGPGGTGKTRLALQVAADLLDRFEHGVWLVELAALVDPGLVLETVATVLGVREEPGRPLLTTLTESLRPRTILLILDNCEHLITICAHLATTLLRSCPSLRILASSREVLDIAGEISLPVPSLAHPDPQVLPPLGTLVRYEAIRLFVDRVQTMQPGFAVTEATAPTVAQVCARLDGIPLAIELAAAQMRHRDLAAIAAGLDDRFRLLASGSPAKLPRQQTLRALIDWSYDLLAPPEQLLLRRLAAFAGGWTLEAAERVGSGEGSGVGGRGSDEGAGVGGWGLGNDSPIPDPPVPNPKSAASSSSPVPDPRPPTPDPSSAGGRGPQEVAVLDGLQQLINKSLVGVSENTQGETRYGLLETIRQYGRERLQEAGEAATVYTWHSDWAVALAEEAESHLLGPEQATWLARLDTEHENLRAALAWSLERPDPLPALRLAGALWRFWWTYGYWSEGRRWLDAALAKALGPPHSAWAKVLNGAGNLAWAQGDYARARLLHEAALVQRRALGDTAGIAVSLGNLGMVAQDQGDWETAARILEESLALRRQGSDQRRIAGGLNSLGNVALARGAYTQAADLFAESLALSRELGDQNLIGVALHNLGNAAQAQGAYRQAVAWLEESLALSRELGHKAGAAATLRNLGYVALEQQDLAGAGAYFTESLALFRELDDRSGIARTLAGLAGVAAAAGRPEHAARLFGATATLHTATGLILWPADRAEYDRLLAAARAALAPAAWDTAYQAGAAWSLDEAITAARAPAD
ncbi:MAG TPA: tetratricopeptide repeat protein [Chloroflexia bacterium]|nr:tetratricopeptide repeat protein [Chloroflexia bacterium]